MAIFQILIETDSKPNAETEVLKTKICNEDGLLILQREYPKNWIRQVYRSNNEVRYIEPLLYMKRIEKRRKQALMGSALKDIQNGQPVRDKEYETFR